MRSAHLSGRRVSVTRRAAAAAVLIAVTSGPLVACGNDSTASDTPTLSSVAPASITEPAPTEQSSTAPSAGAEALAPSGQTSTSPAPPAGSPTDSGPASAPPATGEQATGEQAQPAPGAGSAAASPKEAAYLDALRKQGLTLSGNGENALSIGAYVCQGVQQGASDEELATFVNAMAGSEESVTGGQRSAEAAGKIYLDAAKSTYCA